MTSRERVLAAMRHHRPDRPPFDFSWGFSPPRAAALPPADGRRRPGRLLRRRHPDGPHHRPGQPRDFTRYLADLPPGTWVDEWGVGRQPTTSRDQAHSHLDGFVYPDDRC